MDILSIKANSQSCSHLLLRIHKRVMIIVQGIA